mgnify:CR=1 FL=1
METAWGAAGRSRVTEEAGEDDPACRYEIAGELARGGMGIILLGHDREFRRNVALKVLPPEYALLRSWIATGARDDRAGGRFVIRVLRCCMK